MALSSVQIVTLKCPLLASDANLNLWLQLATQQTDRCFFGLDYNLAIALRACHNYALSLRGSEGQAGTITNRREGDLAISYGAVTINSDLDQTSFGKELKSLIKESRPGITVLGAGITIC